MVSHFRAYCFLVARGFFYGGGLELWFFFFQARLMISQLSGYWFRLYPNQGNCCAFPDFLFFALLRYLLDLVPLLWVADPIEPSLWYLTSFSFILEVAFWVEPFLLQLFVLTGGSLYPGFSRPFSKAGTNFLQVCYVADR